MKYQLIAHEYNWDFQFKMRRPPISFKEEAVFNIFSRIKTIEDFEDSVAAILKREKELKKGRHDMADSTKERKGVISQEEIEKILEFSMRQPPRTEEEKAKDLEEMRKMLDIPMGTPGCL
ncbi:hypothetical protein FACS1894164_18770 [Spirochaetia bacterium]|nr:hypothetical protein FACS1894164_18770 [Spirochaetia bacterium]